MKKFKILHVLYQSTPNISGSSTRSMDIINSQKLLGIEPFVITSPFQKGKKTNFGEEIIEDVPYFRTYSGKSDEEVRETGSNIVTKFKKLFRILNFYNSIEKQVIRVNPDVIHAHAMFFCALPSILIAKKYNIPVVYEVRSLWEERRKDDKPKNIIVKIEHTILKFLETLSMKKCDKIIAINKNLKNEIVSRNIPEEKIYIIENAVNLDFILDQKTRLKMVETHRKPINFGYIGTISPIEGLDIFIKVFKDNLEFSESKLFIYGSGKQEEIENLKKISKNSSRIFFKGSITRNNIYKAYKEIDIIVNPRIKSKITDSVTPLKPLEAMGFNKLVIASDVGGMRELIINNRNGFLFQAENPIDLKKVTLKVLNLSQEERNKIYDYANNFLKEKRSWTSNAEKYKKLYHEMV